MFSAQPSIAAKRNFVRKINSIVPLHSNHFDFLSITETSQRGTYQNFGPPFQNSNDKNIFKIGCQNPFNFASQDSFNFCFQAVQNLFYDFFFESSKTLSKIRQKKNNSL